MSKVFYIEFLNLLEKEEIMISTKQTQVTPETLFELTVEDLQQFSTPSGKEKAIEKLVVRNIVDSFTKRNIRQSKLTQRVRFNQKGKPIRNQVMEIDYADIFQQFGQFIIIMKKGQGNQGDRYNLRPKRQASLQEFLKKNNEFVSFKDLEEEENKKNGKDQEFSICEFKKSNKIATERNQSIDSQIEIDKITVTVIPSDKKQLEKVLKKAIQKFQHYKKIYLQQIQTNFTKKSLAPPNSIPICADIRNFDFQKLRNTQLEIGHRLFDVIMMDPPWRLSSSQPSRGVAIQYQSLSDQIIKSMPIQRLQNDGFIFIWQKVMIRAINAKYALACKLMEYWGYNLVDQITWVKKTVNGKIAKGHGFYLQHAKQSCLIGMKGNTNWNRFKKNVASDVIFSLRRGQSQKPSQIYQYIEQLVPEGFYLQIFGRRNNLRNNWVTIGNEL